MLFNVNGKGHSVTHPLLIRYTLQTTTTLSPPPPKHPKPLFPLSISLLFWATKPNEWAISYCLPNEKLVALNFKWLGVQLPRSPCYAPLEKGGKETHVPKTWTIDLNTSQVFFWSWLKRSHFFGGCFSSIFFPRRASNWPLLELLSTIGHSPMCKVLR
jgi:hypothetical protein